MIKTPIFDASEFLISPQSQMELLADAVESRDGTYINQALDVVVKARGMTDAALDAGVTRGNADMAPASKPFDFGMRDRLLSDPENAVFYLQQILEGGDVELFRKALKAVAKAQGLTAETG